jgi:hypothetical protein
MVCIENSLTGVFDVEAFMGLKQLNSPRLQLADLVARTIGRYVLDSDQPNQAHDLLREKL